MEGLTQDQARIFGEEYDKCLERERYAYDFRQKLGDINSARKNELVDREIAGCGIQWLRLVELVERMKLANIIYGFSPLETTGKAG